MSLDLCRRLSLNKNNHLLKFGTQQFRVKNTERIRRKQQQPCQIKRNSRVTLLATATHGIVLLYILRFQAKIPFRVLTRSLRVVESFTQQDERENARGVP